MTDCKGCADADWVINALWGSQCPDHPVPEVEFKRAARLAESTIWTYRQIAEPFGRLARFVLRNGGTLDQAQEAMRKIAPAAVAAGVYPGDMVLGVVAGG